MKKQGINAALAVGNKMRCNKASQLFTIFALTGLIKPSSGEEQHYAPTWDSLDARPLPSWYDKAKFGIFSHWGLYSVPSIGGEAAFFVDYLKNPNSPQSIFMKKNYRPDFTYADFGPQFTAELFNASNYADIIKSSGARYFVLTSKHHEGYTMWPSKYSWNWNSVDVGPHRDLTGELRDAFQRLKEVHFGLYFSQFEFLHPLYLNDKKNNYTTSDYVKQVSYPQMLEIASIYQPELIWSDGEWEASAEYWESTNFLAWLYNDSPVKDIVVVNDRWGARTRGKHGGFWTHKDFYDPGVLKPHKWETCMTMDKGSWGFRRTMTAEDVRTVKELIKQLARTISCNGNLLLNVGPTHDGRIVPIFEERLMKLGHWMHTNGEAVYGTKPWIHQNDTGNIWYTSRLREEAEPYHRESRVYNSQEKEDTIIYAFVLNWPSSGQLQLPLVKWNAKTKATMLGHNKPLNIFNSTVTGGSIVDLPKDWTTMPSYDAWVVRIEYANSESRDPVKELIRKGLLDERGQPTRPQ